MKQDMEIQLIYKMIMKKKGISGIVATVIMIALVVGVTAIVWVVINNLITDQIGSTESCFGSFGEVTLNKQYTCHDLNPLINEIKFSINIDDLNVDSVLVSISGESGAKSFEIKNSSTYSYVKMFSGSYGGALQLPEKNAALTYIVNLTGSGVSDAKSIKIAPIINDNQCEVSDSIIEVSSC